MFEWPDSVLFVFKQKTAYEMRISDWSSDVCSSDLVRCARSAQPPPGSSRRARSKVDHADARLQEVETVVELGELEGGARAVAALARFGHEGKLGRASCRERGWPYV